MRAGEVERLLRRWGGPGWPSDPEVVARYAEAMQVPFVAHSALEYYRWVVRSQLRPDGRAFVEAIDHPITVPVLQLHGVDDPCILPATAQGSQRWVQAQLREISIEGTGHFLPEERPDVVTAHLLDWLATLT